MSDRPEEAPASVPEATAQVAQEQAVPPSPAPDGSPGTAPPAAPTRAFTVGAAVTRAARVRPYHRRPGDPVYRPLRIYTLDPSQSRLDGALAVVKVPYEPLGPGPVGRLFEVDNADGARRVRYARVDLDAQRALIASGRDPSPADPQFHQQMVYAVCSSVYAAFKAALGRDVAWGHGHAPGVEGVPTDPAHPQFPLRLRLAPHAMRERNAYYAPAQGAILFGYDRARADVDAKNPPGGYVFTCLSHDIIAHELSHALLHGLREQYLYATRPDVPAFHEAFGDLVAVFQHFAYREVVASAISKSGADLSKARMLADLARQFGYTTQAADGQAAGSPPGRQALRTAIDAVSSDEPPRQAYDPTLETHALGSVLVSAVFEAFVTLFRRKTAQYIRLATNGRGELPVGALPHDLQHILAAEASQLASQILGLCIRAIDYCPPVDLELGDYLRAMITADAELVADDPWGYREALVTAFGRRRIFPTDVGNLSESSLRWSPPWRPIEIHKLNFTNLHFSGDPAHSARAEDLGQQARALGEVVTQPGMLEVFGLAPAGGEFSVPVVQSIRSCRRVGPDGQVLFDLVAEVTQQRNVPAKDGAAAAVVFGGSTVIIDPEGMVRYVITKNVRNERRLEDCRRFLAGGQAGASGELSKGAGGSTRQFWNDANGDGRLEPRSDLFRLVHDHGAGAPPG